MGILDTAKEVAVLVQKLDNVELLKQVLELQGQIGELLDERRSLRDENANLRDALSLQDSLFFRDNAYWQRIEGGEVDGPLCSKCWGADGKLLHLHFWSGRGFHICPHCKTIVKLPGTPDPPPSPPPRRVRNWVTDY